RQALPLRHSARAPCPRRRRAEGGGVGRRADRLGDAGRRQARRPDHYGRVPRADRRTPGGLPAAVPEARRPAPVRPGKRPAPELIQAGSAETLLDDAIRLAEAAGSADVSVTLEVWPRMIHAWPVWNARLEPGRRALMQAGEFTRRCL